MEGRNSNDYLRFTVLGVQRSGNRFKFTPISTEIIKRQSNLLGGDNVISVAPSQVLEFDYIVIIPEREAKKREWI